MTVPARITLITLGVRDVVASTAFYEALGWTRSSASVDGAVSFFQMGGSALGLFGIDALADDAHQTPFSGGFHGVSLAINLGSTDEVDRVYAAWVAAGATPAKAPETVFWGGYSSYVADLDGHLWELAFNPGFELLADGAVRLPH
jgi:uncharacterized protein